MIKLKSVKFALVHVTKYTTWHFAVVNDSENYSTVVELTKGESSPSVASLLSQMIEGLIDKEIKDESVVEGLLGTDCTRDGRTDTAAALSALRTAVTQLQALQNNIPLSELLGRRINKSIEVYANINRGLLSTERTPQDFYIAAAKAISRGFKIVKCAPFDEVSPKDDPAKILELSRMGIDRVRAVRSAIGDKVKLLIDCHSRFDSRTAVTICEELSVYSIDWFEEPLEPQENPIALRNVASSISVPVAGGESGYGESFFKEIMSIGAVDIVMPDVKYCGGVLEAVRIGHCASRLQKKFSLHSPAGPVSLLASAQATSVVQDALALEHAIDEVPWRHELITPIEIIENGVMNIPQGVGLGCELNWDVVSKRGEIYDVC